MSARGSESSTITRDQRQGLSPGRGGSQSQLFATRINVPSAANTIGHYAAGSKISAGLLTGGQSHLNAMHGGLPPNNQFMLKRQANENKLLKEVVARLCEKLKDYQK